MTTAIEEQTMTTELGEQDFDLLAAYEEAATADRQPKDFPKDGAYKLRMPSSFQEGAIKLITDRPTRNEGTPYMEATFDNGLKGEEGSGLTIVEGPFEGYNVRFLRATSERHREWDNKARAWGRTFQTSDLLDLLANFARGEYGDAWVTHLRVPKTEEDWRQALNVLAGQIIPFPVYLTWSGYDKGATEAKKKYLKSKDFNLKVDGKRVNYVERTAQKPFEMKIRGEKTMIEEGDSYRIYAQLTLGRRGFNPKN